MRACEDSARGKRRSRGAALVIVLALTALLTVLVVAIFSRARMGLQAAESEVGIYQAEELVQAAVEITLADLLLELKDGAEEPEEEGWMDVEDRSAMVPTKVLKDAALASDPAFATLVKQSVSGSGISTWSDGASGNLRRVSSVSTLEPAAGGRLISPTRWGSPGLTTQPLSPLQVPDWAYLSRDGTNPTEYAATLKQGSKPTGSDDRERNEKFVVGRYAYQIYETGGLLDISAAGFGTDTDRLAIESKGPLLFADLRSLPGGTDGMLGVPEWRNRLTEDWMADEHELTYWGRGNGWLGVRESEGASDNVFLSRQDLIRFSKTRPDTLPESALPYLTHFTRDRNAPSSRPRKNADEWGGASGSEWAYKDNAPGGAPVLDSRFPLSNIDLFAALRAEPGSAEIEEQIEKAFGLVRAGASMHVWRYNAYTNGGGAEEIEDISEVVESEDPPNFFEILKQGMLDGSLGSHDPVLDWFYTDDDYDSSPTRQILRIGACIIDQWDADDIPTVILAPEDGSIFNWSDNVEVAGVENLPYVDIIGQEHIVRWDLPGYPDWPQISGYYKIQLWNPHRNASEAEAGEFRVVLEGEPRVRLGISPEKSWWSQPRPIYWVESEGLPSSAETNYLEFGYPLTAGASAFCERPIQLMGSMVTAGSEDNLLPRGSVAPSFAGLLHGTLDTADAEGMPSGIYDSWGHAQGHFRFNQPVSVRLQKKVDGEWLTYQTIPRIKHHHGNVPWTGFRSARGHIENSAENGNPMLRISYGRADPRSIRFGMGSVGGGGSPHGIEHTVYNPYAAAGFAYAVPNHTAAPGGGEKNSVGFWWQLAQNSTGNAKFFTRRDGVVPDGDVHDEKPYRSEIPALANGSRPFVLNRRFRSLAEMGFAFRDEPFKTLDFSSFQSADYRLLDLFTLTGSPVQAGTFNLNTVGADVLTAILRGAGRDLLSGGKQLAEAEARDLAERFIAARTALGPLRDIGELGDYLQRMQQASGTAWGVPDAEVAEHEEALVRAIADAGTTRSWNFLIDVIGQSGRLTRSANGLEDFVVTGEKRYWMHVAIDRFTGEIVGIHRELADE